MAGTMAGFTVSGYNAIAYDPTTSQYYVLVKASPGARRLGVINPATGVITDRGSLGDNFSSITFAPNGRLFGATGDGASVPEALYYINKTNAAKTFIRTMGNGADGEVICFNPVDANIYHWSGNGTVVYEKMDTITYTITPIGSYSVPIGNGEVFGALFDQVSGNFIVNDISSNVESWSTAAPLSNLGISTDELSNNVDLRSFALGSGVVFNWTNNNTSIGLAANGTGNIASFIATNITNVPVVATITVTPSYTNGSTTCTGTPTTFTITVNPTPVVSITPAGPVTICSGSSVTLTASATCTSFAFSGLMSGSQEVPANASTARGLFNGTFNSSTNQLTLNVIFDGLTGGGAIAAHVHSAIWRCAWGPVGGASHPAQSLRRRCAGLRWLSMRQSGCAPVPGRRGAASSRRCGRGTIARQTG